MSVVILHKAFCKIPTLRHMNDGRMGRDDRRSRCFGRRTDAESTGEATGDRGHCSDSLRWPRRAWLRYDDSSALHDGKRSRVQSVLGSGYK